MKVEYEDDGFSTNTIAKFRPVTGGVSLECVPVRPSPEFLIARGLIDVLDRLMGELGYVTQGSL